MNSLSWFLYAIDVIGNLKILAFMVFLIFIAILIGTIVAIPMTEGDCLDEKSRPTWYKFFWRSIAASSVTFLVFTTLPSRNTMYAIAASQVGEQIVKNEAVQGMASDATKALQQWIKRQIEPETKK